VGDHRPARPTVAEGIVELWGIDPKVIELSAGEPLFTRLAYKSPEDYGCLLEDAGVVMCDPAAAVARGHPATPTFSREAADGDLHRRAGRAVVFQRAELPCHRHLRRVVQVEDQPLDVVVNQPAVDRIEPTRTDPRAAGHRQPRQSAEPTAAARSVARTDSGRTTHEARPQLSAQLAEPSSSSTRSRWRPSRAKSNVKSAFAPDESGLDQKTSKWWPRTAPIKYSLFAE
jgi:hypothetical protein